MAQIYIERFSYKKYQLARPAGEKVGIRLSGKVYTRPAYYNRLVVEACGFKFVFGNVNEIQEYIDWYSKKVHPSTRSSNFMDHNDAQSKFCRLPGYIKSGHKRERVLKALVKAKQQFLKENITNACI